MKKKQDPIKFENLEESDWRGILAAIIIIGGFILVGLFVMTEHFEAVATVAILMYAVTDWYYKAKKEDKNGKTE